MGGGTEYESRGPAHGGIGMKPLSLCLLTFQNSALILVMHYSRIMPKVNGVRYLASTSVLLCELLKLILSAIVALFQMADELPPDSTATEMDLYRNLGRAIFTKDSLKLAVPAAIYVIQNTLQYVAAQNLDAATFQLMYQLKILTTALFSVTLLGRSLSRRKWLSLLLLIIGICIVQLPDTLGPIKMDPIELRESRLMKPSYVRGGDHLGPHEPRHVRIHEGIVFKDDDLLKPAMNHAVGMVAVLISCALSGLAGVLFEKVLKDPKPTKIRPSLWIRNCQLSFWSLFPALLIGVIFMDGENVEKQGFFGGYNWIVWAAVLLQTSGGVVVALVVKYADNIAKNFATSISVVLSCLASVWFFGFEITGSYILGTAVVLFATYLYGKPDQELVKPPNVIISDYEETIVMGDSPSFEKTPRTPVLSEPSILTSAHGSPPAWKRSE